MYTSMQLLSYEFPMAVAEFKINCFGDRILVVILYGVIVFTRMVLSARSSQKP